MTNPSGSVQELTHHHIERLEDVREQLSFMKGEMTSFAKKEDLANLKYNMLLSNITVVAAVLATLVNIGILVVRLMQN